MMATFKNKSQKGFKNDLRAPYMLQTYVHYFGWTISVQLAMTLNRMGLWWECRSLSVPCNFCVYTRIWLLYFLICSTIQLMKLIIETTDCVSIFHCLRSFVSVVHISVKQWATVLDPVGISSCSSSEWAPVVVVPLQDGGTAMMLACQEGHEHVVEALLKGGSTVDIQTKVTPVITWHLVLLHYAHI